jgi:hypothetical protein
VVCVEDLDPEAAVLDGCGQVTTKRSPRLVGDPTGTMEQISERGTEPGLDGPSVGGVLTWKIIPAVQPRVRPGGEAGGRGFYGDFL